MLKTFTKRQLIFLTLAFLFLVVLIYSLFPKMTVASMLQLDSRDQIVKVEIGTGVEQTYIFASNEPKSGWYDITGSLLGDRYIDAFFSKPIVPDDKIRNAMGYEIPENIAVVRITLGNLPEYYPFKDREYRFLIGLPSNTTLIRMHYTTEAQIREQEKLNAEGNGELFDGAPYCEFVLPKRDLFTPDFIDSQFE